MDHVLGPPLKPGEAPTLKIVEGPLRTNDPPTFARADFHIKDHNLHEWYFINNQSIIHLLTHFHTPIQVYLCRQR